ncbi:MAG TPA: hypothetical protein VMU34_15060, partial [Mycobacterium sp.]|nr:hypothetical protein [Mycobacterium sp.]
VSVSCSRMHATPVCMISLALVMLTPRGEVLVVPRETYDASAGGPRAVWPSRPGNGPHGGGSLELAGVAAVREVLPGVLTQRVLS